MGFVEFNVIISELENVEKLADNVHGITSYLMTDYMNGRCDSYNLFSIISMINIFVKLFLALLLLLILLVIKSRKSMELKH